MQAFIHGLILALGLILPLGVQNIFIFNQGATQKRFRGSLPAIITASFCDTLLILLAVAGVSILIFNIAWIKTLLFLVGIIFLLYMGVIMWKSTPEGSVDGKRPKIFSARKQITFAASVSLLNPHAILDTIGVIGTSSLAYSNIDKIFFTAACIGVSWFWFFLLAIMGRKIGQLNNKNFLLKRINQLSAVIIWSMALYLGVHLFV